LDRQKNIRPSTDESAAFRLSKTSITRTADIDNSKKYRSVDRDQPDILQHMLGQNQTTTTTTTTKTTRRSTHDNDGQQQINISRNRNENDISELDEEYMQRKIRITRKYKGKRKKRFSSFQMKVKIVFFLHRKYSY